MDAEQNGEFKPCSPDHLWLAEFTWDGSGDRFAEGQFHLWDPTPDQEQDGLFPVGSIHKSNVQGYYLTRLRIFWMILCAQEEADVKKLCDKVVGKNPSELSPIRYNYWKCQDPQQLINM